MSKKKKATKITNPEGYNQSNPDPRQQVFLAAYINPSSNTFSNAKQSALDAGYSLEYANTITAQMPKWLSDNIRLPNILKKAENNVAKFLADDYKENDKIKADMTKFALSNLGKAWNKNSQHEGKQRMVNVELNIRNLIQGEPAKVEVIDQPA